MKKRIAILMISVLTALCVSACGAPQSGSASEDISTAAPSASGDVSADVSLPAQSTELPEEQPQEEVPAVVNNQELYAPVLKLYYDAISHAVEEPGVMDEPYGVHEAVAQLGEGAADVIGFVFRDLNGDGTEELLIGVFEKTPEAYSRNELYGVYTHDGQQPVLVLEGAARNAYSLTQENTFFHNASSGAMYSICGEFELGADGELVCKDYYFTHEKDEDFNLGFFHNTSGEWDVAVSEELELDWDGYAAIQDALAQRTVALEDSKFSSLKDVYGAEGK